MKIKNLTLLVLLVIPFLTSGQHVKAIADYQQTFNMEGAFNGRQLTGEQQERLASRMRSMPPLQFRLTVAGERSGYEPVASGKSEQPQRRFGFSSGSFFKDAAAGTSVNRVEIRDSVYLVTDTLRAIQWKLHKETMEIGPLLCYMATASVPRMGGGGFPGRGNGQEGAGAQMEVVAWYCPEIASNQGPGRYWGLPGLILEVEEPNALIQCVNIELFPEGLKSVEFPGDGEIISSAEYAQKMRAIWEERRNSRPQRN